MIQDNLRNFSILHDRALKSQGYHKVRFQSEWKMVPLKLLESQS